MAAVKKINKTKTESISKFYAKCDIEYKLSSDYHC